MPARKADGPQRPNGTSRYPYTLAFAVDEATYRYVQERAEAVGATNGGYLRKLVGRWVEQQQAKERERSETARTLLEGPRIAS